ncbi:MAG TPA: hypothetical protein VI837_02800 [Blastocatellia bacterium]|nr:hypothetical protein [Blastocatellia bacterium]
MPALPGLLGVLCIFAVIGLCSCALSAERGAQPQQENSSSARQNAAKPAAGKKPTAPADPNKFALVVAGAGGEEAYTRKFTAQATRLYEALTVQLGFAAKNVTLLTETASGAGPEDGARESEAAPSRRATADEVRKAFASIKSAANGEAFVLVVLIGHGSFDNQQAKFNLIGPDLTAKDYAQLLGSLPNKRVVFVDCASSSGEFIKPLSAEGRIVITATRSGSEQNATVFADHFIAGLMDGAADADKNGRVSVLEAFNYATKLTADWYKQKNRLATEHALIDDNADGAGHEEATAGDGAVAKVVFLDSKHIEEAAGDAELGRLIRERQRFEEEVEKLKTRKSDMKPEDYEAELERLLVELAKVNQQIKAKQK